MQHQKSIKIYQTNQGCSFELPKRKNVLSYYFSQFSKNDTLLVLTYLSYIFSKWMKGACHLENN